MMRLLTITAVVLATANGTALAQETEASADEARALFQLATVHYGDGRFVEAAQEFEQAYELSGEAVLTHNIYLCYRDANRPDEAAVWLRRYLESGVEIQNRDILEARLRALESGRRPTEPDETPGPAPAEHGPTTANIIGHATAFTLAGLTLISGIVTGAMAASLNGDLHTRCESDVPCADPEGPADKARMQNLAVATDVLLATSLVAAVAGVVIALLGRAGPDGEDESPVACGPTGCALRAAF